MAGDAAARAASAVPAFGSVTQSSNMDGNGVSSDGASTRYSWVFDATTLTITITRGDGNTLSLDTTKHRINPESDPFRLFDPRSTESTIAHVWTESRVTSTGDDATDDANALQRQTEGHDVDYLAFGYWLHARGDLENDDVSAVEIGAFVDGPELRGTSALPAAGTAMFSGHAAGLYAEEAGTDATRPQGTYVSGEFYANMTLEADFDDQSVSGIVSNITLPTYIGVRPDGSHYDDSDRSPGYNLELGSASLGSNGTFTGSNVTLEHDRLEFRQATGSWGGRFSDRDMDDNEIPDAAGGTFGVTASTSGGTTATFVGGYFGEEDTVSLGVLESE